MTAHRIGVISDTHGLLRDGLVSLLAGCDLIIHAGDIGDPSILHELRTISEVVAVRGNVDAGSWAQALKLCEIVEVSSRKMFVIHRLNDIAINPASEGIDAVIYGHTHRPDIRSTEGVLYLNPGSAGPRRFDLPVSMALMEINEEGLSPEIVEIRT